jgi:membrane associated rhomboid family serine protease
LFDQSFQPIAIAIALISAFAVADLWQLKRKQPEVFPGLAAWLKHLLAPVALGVAALFTDPRFFSGAERSATELLMLGASYWPRTVSEPWRLLSSLGLHAGPAAVAVCAFSLTVIGRTITATIGLGHLGVIFLIAGVAGVLGASNADPQSLYFGLGPAIAGLAGAIIALLVDPTLRRRMGAATFATITLHFGYFVLHPLGTNTVGMLCGLAAGFIYVFSVVLLPVRNFAARASGAAVLFAALGLWFSHLPHSADRHAFLARVDLGAQAAAERLVDLQQLLATHQVSDADFARRVETEVLAPIRLLRDETESLLSQEDTRDDINLLTRKSDLAFRILGTEVMRDVFAARESVLRAEELEPNDPKMAESHLNQFWSRALASLSKHREVIDNEILITTDPKTRKTLEALRLGLEQDIALLTESAVELEIRQTETWLMRLRANVLQVPSRAVASLRSESHPDLANRVDARLKRLVAVAGRLPQRNERLEGLQSHLSHIRAAIH